MTDSPRREGRFARLRRTWREAGVTDQTHTLTPAGGPHPLASQLINAHDHAPIDLRALVDTSWLPSNAVWLAPSNKRHLPTVGRELLPGHPPALRRL